MTGWKDAPLVPLIMLHWGVDHQSNELVKGKLKVAVNWSELLIRNADECVSSSRGKPGTNQTPLM